MEQTRSRNPRAPRNHRVFANLTASDHRQLAEIAAADGLPVAVLLYTIIRKEITRVRHNESQNRARELRRSRRAGTK